MKTCCRRPRVEAIGRIVRESDAAVYRYQVCLHCGAELGVVKVAKP